MRSPEGSGEWDHLNPSSPPLFSKDLDDLKRQVQQMQEEAEKLEEIQKEVEAQMGSPSSTNAQSVDARSVYVGNVRPSRPALEDGW